MIAAVTETWHNASDDPNLIACTPIDYCCIDRARPRQVDQIGSNHGGVCMFHHRAFRVRPLPLPNYDRFEYISNYIQGRGINLIVIVIYRPGSEYITDAFIDELADLLERLAVFPSPLLILGDVNVHLDESDPWTAKFMHLLTANGLVQHVKTATHVRGHLLDVVITRDDSLVNSLTVDPPALSDHSLILGLLSSTAVVGIDEERRVFRRRWRQFNLEAFTSDLQCSVSTILQSAPTAVDEWFAVYDRLMRSLLDKHAPQVFIRSIRRQCAPWFDEECRAAKVGRRKAEKRYRIRGSVDNLAEWRRQSQAVRSLFQSKYSAYWSETFVACRGDTRQMWSNVDRLLRHNTSPSSSLNVEVFSDYFRSKVAKIRQSTAGAPRPVIEQRSTKAFDVFDPVTVDEVLKLLRISPSKHCCLDPVPTWLLKRTADSIAPLICSMCNASLQSGSLPATQKQAIVFPRLKKPTMDADDPCSFRPISNLSFITKLVERATF